MGANERRDFSVLGDTVNLASRVESLNKDMHSRILVTSSTYEIVRDTVGARGPLIAHVKGKEESVVVYEIFGWQEKSNTIAQLLEDRSDVDVLDGNRQWWRCRNPAKSKRTPRCDIGNVGFSCWWLL